MNFDAKVRRQSIEPEDLVHAHVGGVDLCARAFLLAADLVERGQLKNMVDQRYSGWESPEARAMLNGQMDLEKIAAMAEREMLNPTPRSGRQEQYENLIARSF